ncbi:MAG: RAMP superfamily CRISPR-associated protein [Candidatus Methanofastidiosia archaeon]
MSWKCYKLVYEAKAPIHIGYRKLGIVSRTRYYILGRNFWGAATAILTRKIMKDYDSKIYKNVGEFVKKNIIFSHFYVCENDKILYPIFSEDGLKYENHSEHKFEKKYISSYVSTALEITSKTAEEESLHEIEFIKPKYKENDGVRDTEFFGHVFVNENPKFDNDINDKFKNKLKEYLNQEKLKEIISELWVGGERNYGFGRVELENENFKETDKIFKKEDFQLTLDNEKPLLASKNSCILALSHVLFNENIKLIKGDIEPLVGRIWSEKGAGHTPEFSNVALVPGTKFEFEGEIEIGNYGLWRII